MPLPAITGYIDLGMWEDAWEALTDLPAEERASNEALRVGLRCASKLGKWEIGDVMAELIARGSDEDRSAAAAFWLELAADECEAGLPDFAKEAIKKAVKAWPDSKLAILQDPRLEAVWA